MKHVYKKILCVLMVAVLSISTFACANGGSDETTKPVVYVPATQPDYSDETTAPIYTRPGEDGEDSDISLENPDGDTDVTDTPAPDDDDSGASSTGGGSTTTESAGDDGDTFADGGVTSNMQGSAKELSWSNINTFSTDPSKLSTAQRRALCVDFFRYAKTALWTPDESISYIKNAAGTADSMTGDSLYGGLPYVGSASGNVYRLLDYVGADGKVDMSDMLGSTSGTLSTGDLKYFGNQCANGCHVGWSRVINSVSGFATMRMTQNNGYIPVGSYTYDTTKIKSWKDADGYRTTDVVKYNGEQTMYESYAKLQIADGLVYYTTAGHVIMCASEPHIEYIQGTKLIDGNKSYITIIDQAQKWETYTSGGKTYQVKSSVDAQVTFKKLFSSNYVPFTFAEFLGTDPVEATTYSFSHTGATASMSELFSGKVTSNYAVTDAYIIVTDASGKEVYKHAVRNPSGWTKTVSMAESGENVDTWGTLPTTGTYTVKVVAQLGTGQRPTVYTGTLAF